jgi:hypothetical protein
MFLAMGLWGTMGEGGHARKFEEEEESVVCRRPVGALRLSRGVDSIDQSAFSTRSRPEMCFPGAQEHIRPYRQRRTTTPKSPYPILGHRKGIQLLYLCFG